MNGILLVIGHGRRSGLCHRLLDVVRGSLTAHDVPHRVHDLLADGFDPRLELGPDERHATACGPEEDALVHRYQADVRWADAYVVIHPVWWFAPPAILKGWIDRVLVHDVAIRQQPSGPPTPLLQGRRALVVQTFNASRAIDLEVFDGISGRLWREIVFPSIGVAEVDLLGLHEVEALDETRLDHFENDLRGAVARLAAGR